MDFRAVVVPALLIGLAACLPAGCGSRPVVVEDPDPARNHLIEIVSAYTRASQQQGRPPRRLEDIRPHFSTPDPVERLLRSPNDGEPYVIAWGADVLTPPPDEGTPVLLVHEKVGSGGTRRAATVWGTTLVLTDAQFKQARFPKAQQAPR